MKILHEFENSFCHEIRIMQKSSDKKNCTMLTYWQLSPVKSQAITSSPVKSNLHLRCYQNIGTEKADSAFLPVANHTQQRCMKGSLLLRHTAASSPTSKICLPTGNQTRDIQAEQLQGNADEFTPLRSLSSVLWTRWPHPSYQFPVGLWNKL